MSQFWAVSKADFIPQRNSTLHLVNDDGAYTSVCGEAVFRSGIYMTLPQTHGIYSYRIACAECTDHAMQPAILALELHANARIA